MGWRRGAYVISGIAAAGLLAELTWAIADRIHLHAVDHGIRLVDALRDATHI